MKNTSTPTSNLVIQFKKKTFIRNFSLEGFQKLHAQKIIVTCEQTFEKKSRTAMKLLSEKEVEQEIEPLTFNLVEVSSEELATFREKEIPSFVLKVDNRYFYSQIPKKSSFMGSSILNSWHLCALHKNECYRLSAASDEDGGCAKVRERSTGIERYPWITSGYESFATRHDCFIVNACKHYAPYHSRR